MRELITKGIGNEHTTYYEELIPINEITSSTTGIYVPAADLVVTNKKSIALNIHHPFCSQKIHNDYLTIGTNYSEDSTINIGNGANQTTNSRVKS